VLQPKIVAARQKLSETRALHASRTAEHGAVEGRIAGYPAARSSIDAKLNPLKAKKAKAERVGLQIGVQQADLKKAAADLKAVQANIASLEAGEVLTGFGGGTALPTAPGRRGAALPTAPGRRGGALPTAPGRMAPAPGTPGIPGTPAPLPALDPRVAKGHIEAFDHLIALCVAYRNAQTTAQLTPEALVAAREATPSQASQQYIAGLDFGSPEVFAVDDTGSFAPPTSFSVPEGEDSPGKKLAKTLEAYIASLGNEIDTLEAEKLTDPGGGMDKRADRDNKIDTRLTQLKDLKEKMEALKAVMPGGPKFKAKAGYKSDEDSAIAGLRLFLEKTGKESELHLPESLKPDEKAEKLRLHRQAISQMLPRRATLQNILLMASMAKTDTKDHLDAGDSYATAYKAAAPQVLANFIANTPPDSVQLKALMQRPDAAKVIAAVLSNPEISYQDKLAIINKIILLLFVEATVLLKFYFCDKSI